MAFSILYVKPNIGPQFRNKGTGWWRHLLRFDSGYYMDIAQSGYAYHGNPTVWSNVAFFPGYPLLIRAGMAVLPLEAPLVAVLIANLCSALGIVLLFILVRRLWNSETALLTVTLICLFPTSLFLSAAYSESAALLFTAAAFLFLFRGQFIPAALCIGYLSATRPLESWPSFRCSTNSGCAETNLLGRVFSCKPALPLLPPLPA